MKPGQRFWPFLLATLFLTSCATVFNRPNHRIHIATNIAATQIEVAGQVQQLIKGQASLMVERKCEPLVIRIPGEDSSITISVRPRNSVGYIYGLVCTYGLGAIVDRKSQKRYSYPKNVYIEQDSTTVRTKRFAPTKKGTLSASFSIPFINHFSIRQSGIRHDRGGFLGLGAGLDYAVRQNRYYCLQAGIGIDNEVPAPVAVEHFGSQAEYIRTYAAYLNLSRHTVFGSFDAGYGISLSKLHWVRTKETATSFEKKMQRSVGIGPTASLGYRITRGTSINLIYQPMLMCFNKSPFFTYQHFSSLEFVFPIFVHNGR